MSLLFVPFCVTPLSAQDKAKSARDKENEPSGFTPGQNTPFSGFAQIFDQSKTAQPAKDSPSRESSPTAEPAENPPLNRSFLISPEQKANVLQTAKRYRASWEKFPDLKIFYMNDLGIRRVAGTHTDLFTDLPSTPETDEIPAVLDAALPELCRFFHLDESEYKNWKITAFLMSEREPFELFNAMEGTPDFPNGYSLRDRIWIFDKKQPYFNRFLLLHEMVHVFMAETFGALEPAWYSEGIAEFLALHRWENGRLTLGIFPDSPEQVPGFGRIELVQDEVRAGEKRSADEIFGFTFEKYEENEVYAWCWLMVTLLANNPRDADAFDTLPYLMMTPNPTGQFLDFLGDEADHLPLEIDDFARRVDYAYDFAKNGINFRTGEPIQQEAEFKIDASGCAWQNSGLQLKAGKTYAVAASGRFKVGGGKRTYPCETNGITLRYQNGLPLGRLTAWVIPDTVNRNMPNKFPEPVEIGTKGEITPEIPGTLYFRLNLPPGEISRASGECTVRITEKGKP